MKDRNKIRIWLAGVLFFAAFTVCLLMQRGNAKAVAIPEGSYTPTGSAITYTFTGASDDLNNGFVANVERYSSAAIVDGQLRIPSTIEYQRNGENVIHVRVAGILRGVFSGSTSLTKLLLPDSVTYIGQEAFANCSNLASIQTYKSEAKRS